MSNSVLVYNPARKNENITSNALQYHTDLFVVKTLHKGESTDKAARAHKTEKLGKMLFGEDGHAGDAAGLLGGTLSVQGAEHTDGAGHCGGHGY